MNLPIGVDEKESEVFATPYFENLLFEIVQSQGGEGVDLSSSSGSASIGHIHNGTGAVATTVQAKLRETCSVKDFGADGITDDTTEIQAADDSTFKNIYVPEGDYSTTLANFNSLSKRYFGEGQIGTTAGKVSPFFAQRDGLPSSFGVHSSQLTAFDGDISGSVFQASQSVRNGSLGTPTSGFLFTLETALSYHFTTVNSADGHNNSTSDNTGRTGYVQNKGQIIHQGNGDAIVNHAGVSVSGSKSGATHFLAQPAGVLYGGLVIAGAAKTNLTLGEIALDDNGFDCRGTGFIMNFDRSVTTGTNAMFWNGIRLQSRDQECEAAYQVVGSWGVGLDMTPATIGSVGIALKQGQKIEFHATVTPDSAGVERYADNFNNWDIQYNGTSLLFRAAGTNAFQLNASQATFTVPVVITAAAGLNLSNASGDYKINGTQVVTARITGYTNAMTGTADRATSYATSTITLEQLAERVKAIQDDLTTHGMIGA